MNTSERDTEIKSSILRGLESTARDCEQLAADASAGDDTESAIDLHQAALRYRQLVARAMGCWADADALTALTANATAYTETHWRPVPTGAEEVPRVH